MSGVRRAAIGLALSVGARALAGQSGGATPAFLAAAAAAAARYQDPGAASADGYRQVGPDFPGMGQHWLNAGLLVDTTLSVDRPQLLEYAALRGRLTLVGIAYAALTTDGTPPSAFPVPSGVWHFHAGPVEEESFMSSHAGAGNRRGDLAGGPCVAVLHVWVGLENPDGIFASDNWALPYARRGLRAPAGAPSLEQGRTARALALAAGQGYLDDLIRVVGRPDSAESAGLREVVRRTRGKVLALLAGPAMEGDGELDRATREGLAEVWSTMWAELRAAARPPVWARIAGYAER